MIHAAIDRQTLTPAVTTCLPTADGTRSQPDSVITTCLAELHEAHRGEMGGVLASYIPELTKVDPRLFGIALVTADGQPYAVGDSKVPFTVQSISKAFVYGLALEDHGLEGVLARVGVEPSGDAFNAIVFDERTNRPFNPMVNAGAIATTGLIKGHGVDERIGRIVEMFRRYTGRTLEVDEQVFGSESATGHRNRAITWLMLNFGMVDARVDEHLEVYFRQCSLLVTAEDLAMMAATLANGGVNPITGERALETRYVKYVTAVMASCGMYDFAGEWSFRVGLPAKSGVGGGIVAVLPGQMGVGTFSPLLDDRGNSLRGIRACEALSQRFGLHVFDPNRSAQTAVAHSYRADQVRSKVMRCAAERRILDQHGCRIAILEVQGDLQFGAAEQVLRQAMQTVEQSPGGCDHLVLHLHRVGRVSTAAGDLIAHLRTDLARLGVNLYFAAAGVHRPVLLAAGLPPAAFHATLDDAMEHCEAAVLASVFATDTNPPDPSLLTEIELLHGLGPADLDRVAAQLQPEHYRAGATIIRQGDAATSLFFLTRGRVAIRIPGEDGTSIRLTTISPGVAFGEMALLDGGRRSADAVSETDCDVLRLDLTALETLGRQHPNIEKTILTNIARIMSGHLRRANSELRVLSR
jgi:glutaminase